MASLLEVRADEREAIFDDGSTLQLPMNVDIEFRAARPGDPDALRRDIWKVKRQGGMPYRGVILCKGDSPERVGQCLKQLGKQRA